MRRLVGIIQSLTPARIVTLAGVYFGYGLSVLLRRPIVFSSPAFITLEPFCGCNLQCPECPIGTNELVRSRGMVDLATVDSVIACFGKSAIWANLYFQGEPLLHPQLSEIVARFSSQKIFTSISTNGLLLTSEMMDKLLQARLGEIIFSVDGASDEEYLAYRKGGSFHRVIASIQLVVAKRKAAGAFFPRIVYQTLVTSANEDNLTNIKRFAYSIGVDAVEFKTLNLHHGEDSNHLLPSKSKFSRYSNPKSKEPKRISCFRLWSNAVVAWDGRMALCCMDKEAVALGCSGNSSLAATWRSARLNSIRSGMLSGTEISQLCRNCSLMS